MNKRGHPTVAAAGLAKSNIKKPATTKNNIIMRFVPALCRLFKFKAKNPPAVMHSASTTTAAATGRSHGQPQRVGTSTAMPNQRPVFPAPQLHAGTSTAVPKQRPMAPVPPRRAGTSTAAPKQRPMASAVLPVVPKKNAVPRPQADQQISKALVTLKSRKTELKVESMEQRRIVENSTGHSYESIFAKCMDAKVTAVNVEDPWLLSKYHQLVNFVKFCELLVRKCPNLRLISLLTKQKVSLMKKEVDKFGESLRTRKIDLVINYMESMHDREIRFNNGWLVKMGRGLDIYKGVDKFALGAHDYHLRPCKATMIEIFKTVVTTNDPLPTHNNLYY